MSDEVFLRMLRVNRKLNKASYNAIAKAWDEARRRVGPLEQRILEAFLKDLPRGSSILDLGCGTGRPVGEYILLKGHDLTGVDQAGEMLTIAKARFQSAKWIESDIESFQSDKTYWGIVCWDALFHIQRHAHAGIFRKLAKLLNPKGKLLITVGGSGPNELNGSSDGFIDTMFGQQFFYDSYAPEVTVRVLKGAGLEILLGEFIERPDKTKEKGRYVILACRP